MEPSNDRHLLGKRVVEIVICCLQVGIEQVKNVVPELDFAVQRPFIRSTVTQNPHIIALEDEVDDRVFRQYA